MSAHVYRAFNADGVLLYVGSTCDLARRTYQHSLQSRWWLSVYHIISEAFDDLTQARDAELAAITSEFPRWNVRDRSPQHPDGKATSYLDLLGMFPEDCRYGMGDSPLVRNHRRRNRAA